MSLLALALAGRTMPKRKQAIEIDGEFSF